MYDLQLIEDRIMSIAKQQGLSKNKLLVNAKLGKGVFDSMKKGAIPSVEKIHIIADYLNCSVDYLLGRTDCQKLITLPTGVAEAVIKKFQDVEDSFIFEKDFMNYPNIQFKYHFVKEGEDYDKALSIYDRVYDYYKDSRNIMSKEDFIRLFEYHKMVFGYYLLKKNNYNIFHEIYKLYEQSFV